ncbi:MAG: hypothetical protein ACR2LV_11635 [Solirubrobacteraceae bacterium]
MSACERGRALELAHTLADMARAVDGVTVWAPQADGPLFATLVLYTDDERYAVTIEGPAVRPFTGAS